MTNEIEKTINLLADKFGETGTKLFNTMVSAQRFDAIVGIVFGIVCLIAVWIMIKKFGFKDEYDDYSPIVIVYICLIPIGMLFIFMNLQGVVFPEAVLIKSLLTNY